MKNGVKLSFSGMIALGIAVAIGCGSTSIQPVVANDSGPSAESGSPEAGLDTGTVASCNPLQGHLCAQGETCCFSGIQGTCVDIGACNAPFQVACISKSSCNGGVCCGSVQLSAGFDASAFDAAGFEAGAGASRFDASGFGLNVECASVCSAPDFQLCAGPLDCPNGYVCAGGANGTGFGSLLACIAADGGSPAPDASPETGAPTADAGGDG